jgi:hypothetical protein
MGFDSTGKIYIPISDFLTFVQKYFPDGMINTGYLTVGNGKAGITFTETDVEVDYAMSTECAPEDWADPPGFVLDQQGKRKP